MGSEASPAVKRTSAVTIEKMVFGGEGLARTPEGVVLVPLVAPGEEVVVEIDELSKGVRRGTAIEIVKPSPDRVTAPCAAFAQCGGCQYQHLRYEKQVDLKSEILRESFERIGKLKLDVPVATLAAEPFGYRNRVRLRVEKDDAGFRLGYFGRQSHRLVEIGECPIASPAIGAAISTLLAGAGAECFPVGDAELDVFDSGEDGALLLTVYSAYAASAGFGDELRSKIAGAASVAWLMESRGRRPAHPGAGWQVWGPGFVECRIGDHKYRVSHDSFFQANRHLAGRMIEAVLDGMEGKRALDLYAGVGLFSVPLAGRFGKVSAVESQPSSSRDLQANLKSNGKVVSDRARGFEMTAEQFLAKAASNWDSVVVDPPRGGLNRPVIEHLVRIRPRRLAYLSCDPSTLARDAAAFVRAGYRIRSVYSIDQFPQTFHIESLVHFELG